MADMNSTVVGSAVTQALQPVTGKSLFWAVVTLALSAMAQSSLVADQFCEAESNPEGGLVPYASSPIHCALDALFECAILVRYGLTVTGLWKREPCQPPATTSASSEEADEPSMEPVSRKIIAARTILFTLAVAPQAVKVFSMRGIPVTQLIVACYLLTIITRLLCAFAGERLEDDKRIILAYRKSIAEDKMQFIARSSLVHLPLCAWVGLRALQKLQLAQSVLAPVRRLLDLGFFYAQAPFILLQIIRCFAILFNQWKIFRWWRIPLSPMALILPLLNVQGFVRDTTGNGQAQPGNAMPPFSFLMIFRACMLMYYMIFLSYILAALMALGIGRFARHNKLEDYEHAIGPAADMLVSNASPTPAMPGDTGRPSMSHDPSSRRTSAANNTPSDSSVGPDDSASDPLPAAAASDATEDHTSRPAAQDDQEETEEDFIRQMSPAEGSRLGAIAAAAIAFRSFTSKTKPDFEKAVASLHPVDQMSISAWKTVVIIVLGLLSGLVSGPDNKSSKKLASKSHEYWSPLFNRWLNSSIAFRNFRSLMPEAFRSVWRGTSDADRSRTLARRLKDCGVLSMWVAMWLIAQAIVFLIYTVFDSVELTAAWTFLDRISARFGEIVWWTAFAFFNLGTAAIYYLVVFDGTGTVNPNWNSWFGR